MEDQHDEEWPPIPPDVLHELKRVLLDGSFKWLRPTDPLVRRIPRAYLFLDTNYIRKLVRAGVEAIPGIIIGEHNEFRARSLKNAHDKLGEHLKKGRLEGESDDAMIQRVVRAVLAHLAHTTDDEKQFIALAHSAYRQARRTPRRGPRSLKKECFWAIDSCLGPEGYGFPEYHWARRAYEGGKPLPPPFDDASRPHTRPTMAELIRMIRAGVSDPKTKRPIPESTARKYARLWEEEVYPDKLDMKQRWALHKARTKAKKARR